MTTADNGAIPIQSSNKPVALSATRAPNRRWLLVPIFFSIIFGGALILLARYFPFSEKSVTESLRETFPSTLTIDHFETVYFPSPGCRAEGVTFRLKSSTPGSPPIVTIGKLTIQANYADLLLRPHHISRVVLDDLRVQIPSLGKGGDFRGGYSTSQMTIGEVVANGAVLEFARANSHPPLRFDIHELSLGSASAKNGMSYQLSMQNPEPPGEIRATGHFGPFNAGNPGQTAVSGSYSFNRADLSSFHGIAGILASKGAFSGPLAHVDVQGTTDVPDFEVVHSGHAARLLTHFQASVDGTNGDVALNTVTASYLSTGISAKGSVAGKKDRGGKFTSLDFAVRNGRIQDILRIFVSANRPPMSGVTSFQAHVMVPPDGRPFLKEVRLQGDFGVGDGHFEKPSTQESIDKLSQTARGQKKTRRDGDEKDPPDNVISNLGGHVVVRDAIATFSDLSFTVPGADARMHGTYNLLNGRIDFHGTVKMNAKFSQSTSGIKSIFAKVLDPFFDKKHGSVVPVLMDGTYHSPHFGVDLNPIKGGKDNP
jgi:AsmA-like C-terminal region